MPNFLDHLKEIAQSPLAFVGYLFVIIFWGIYIYLKYRNAIVSSFKDEKLKLSALEKLVNNSPPKNVEVLPWYELKLKDKIHLYFFVSFIATLLTIIILFSLSIYKSNDSNSESHIPKSTVEQKGNSNNEKSFNENENSFNDKKRDSNKNTSNESVEKNSNNKDSFNKNNNSFNSK